jgi:ubiquinone/menaquinone biosynthesis C-methylase UbiE
MNELNNAWKDNGNIFYQQLSLIEKELKANKENYPPHWKDFLELITHINCNKFLDIGCGCGVFYGLFKKEKLSYEYTGIDYSNDAISIAKQKWSYPNFFIKDFWDIDNNYIKNFDAVHYGAILDVMSNGDEALDRLLSFDSKNILIGRIHFTDKESFYDTYDAYGIMKTNKYYHNYTNFINQCNKYQYNIIQTNSSILLKK